MSGGLRSADHLLRPQANLPASDQAGATAAAGPEPAADQRLIPAMSSWGRAFPGVPRQVKVARHFVASLLDGSSLRDDAVIVISELFTNALQHTCSGRPGGLVVVQVGRWRQGVRIAVTDQGSAQRPVIRDARADHDDATSVTANRPFADAAVTGLADGVLADRLLTDRLLAGGMFADDVLADGADPIPADCGRGLYMVSCLAEYLDWHDDVGGRTVHAVLGRLPAGSPRGVGRLGRAARKPAVRPQQLHRLDGPDDAGGAHQVDIAFRSA
jgi:anti-sigma regulatory factor (Ser/Thr protein kinase)